MTELSQMLSAKPEAVVDAIRRVQEENGQLKASLTAVQAQIVEAKVQQIPDGQENAYIFEEVLDAGAHRNFVNLLTQKCTGICAVFAGSDEEGYRYIIGSAAEDTRTVNNILKEKFGAKGGGKPEMVQGSLIGTRAEIKAALQL
jgi:alanyl-tRNA synthetase